MTKKTTKRAFMLSLLSLLMCCTMLLGTTFAWFTDTVTSTGNRIVAGTLDVKLLMDKAEDGNYTDISNRTGDIFDENGNGADWEPGKTEIVYLAVANGGTLDLAYEIILDIKGELVGALEYAILDGAKAADLAEVTSWTELVAIAGVQKANMAQGRFVAAPYGALTPKAQDYFALAVHMKETAGNEYQAKDVTIDVRVAATQLNSEADSFNSNYDADAWNGEVASEYALKDETNKVIKIANGPQLALLAQEVNAGNKFAGYTVVLTGDIDLGYFAWTPIDGFQGTFDGDGYTISHLNVFAEKRAGLFGAARSSTIKNVTIDGAIVTGYNHVAALVANGTCAKITNCTVTNAKITASTHLVNGAWDDGDKAGAIIGYLSGETVGYVKDCTVSNVTVTGYRDIGAVVGIANQTAEVSGNTVTKAEITCDYTHNYKDYGVQADFHVAEVVGEVHSKAIVADNTFTEVTVNVPFALATPTNVNDVINKVSKLGGGEIMMTAGKYEDTIVMKSDITLVGTTGVVVDCINLNGADNIVLKNITFDAAGAKKAYDGKGNERFYANILSGASNKNTKGTNGLVIDGCVFTGTFANGGTTIAFNDQKRGSGQSGDITIKNCEFKTTGAYVDIYTYYSGKGSFVIENNTFASNVVDRPIYLGNYQSSTPVVVKNNAFKNSATFADAAYIQDHSEYGVSFDASNNTFAN